jgi:molybdopterin-guanine dinucleotide biosynthesis protein A
MCTFVDSGGRKIDTWYAQHKVALARFNDRAQMFDNINTPEQRDALHAHLTAGSAQHPSGTKHAPREKR